MNKRILILLMLAFWSSVVWAQPYSVVTNPAEDTRTGMNVSWAVDTTVAETYVSYTLKSDKKWKHAVKIYPQKELCTVFDSVYSKNAAGENFYESAAFYKCGAELRGLEQDKEYMYVVCAEAQTNDAVAQTADAATQAQNPQQASPVHYFKTSGATSWSACIISDFHTYPPLPKRLEAADAMIGEVIRYDPKIDWVLHLGDVCAWGGSYSFWKQLYENQYFARYMWAGVNGNHDNMTRKYQLTNEFFRNANFNPRNGYPGEEGVCYFFKYGDALFIMLNNENMRQEDGLAAAQTWVREVVEGNPSKYVVVCEHYQWFFGEDGRDSQYARWKELFDELGVDLALAGNNHIYVRTNAIYDGHETDGSAGTVYVQTPSSDDERGVVLKDSLEFNLDKIRFRWSEGDKTVGAMHIKVSPKGMKLVLLNRSGKVLDEAYVLAM